MDHLKFLNMQWFVRRGIFFRPISWPGWLILTGVMAYAVYLFIKIDRNSHSVSDTLINWLLNMLLVGLIYAVLGYFTSKE